MRGTAARRILVYAQHLSGVGHYVRTFEIARALAPHHQVHWIEGGRPVPHRPCPDLHTVKLPRICRDPAGGLVGVEAMRPIADLLGQRAARLLAAIRRIRPEIFLVEYFPFSKWELADELLPAIEAVHAGGGRVACSLRDVVRKTRFETVEASAYTARVTDLLNRHFDAVLVHADPALVRLDEHFPAVGDIRIPVHYTGLVSEKPVPEPYVEAEIDQVVDGRSYVLASAGGGAGGRRLIESVLRAWRDPDIAGGRLLVVLSGLDWPQDPLLELQRQAGTERIVIRSFSAGLLHWLARADASISQCGYNTAANLLETRARAVVSPDPRMSDQGVRAKRLAELGLVELLDPAEVGATRIADVVLRVLAKPSPVHPVALDGAERTRRWIEAWA